ncbi:hypothetical protein ACK1CN_04910 [Vibrio coralliilyticus]|nr:hypothetical protein [Vibrio coralliilyticus]
MLLLFLPVLGLLCYLA